MMEKRFGVDKEKLLKQSFALDGSLEINLKKELDGVSDIVTLPVKKRELDDYEFSQAIEPIRKLAAQNNYSMGVLCELPTEARINTGDYLIQGEKIHYLIFKKRKNLFSRFKSLVDRIRR